MGTIRDEGKIPDEEAFEAGIREFSAQFTPSVSEHDEPEAHDQGAAHKKTVDSDVTLPEEDITRDES
jgi:hypothetical protein